MRLDQRDLAELQGYGQFACYFLTPDSGQAPRYTQ